MKKTVMACLKATPRPVKSLMLAMAGVIIIAVIALAAIVLFTIPGDITIIPGPTAAEVFLDPECTTPVSTIHWGQAERGTHLQFGFYIKNTGVEPIDVSITIAGDVSDYMTYSFTPASLPLNAGEVGLITWEADILATAPLATISWEYLGGTP